MARDREILSDKEMMRSVLDIVEYLKDCKVGITFFSGENYVKNTIETPNIFTINIATPAIPNIDKYTALAHECGHILGETPMSACKKLLNRWVKEFKYNDGTTPLVKRLYSYYFSCFNVIEDQRIEYYVANYLWRNYIKKFNTTRRKLGEDMQHADSPIEWLLAERFIRPELVPNEHKEIISSVIKNVQGTSKWGALKMMVILKPILDEWFKRNYELINETPIIPETFGNERTAEHIRQDIQNAGRQHDDSEMELTDDFGEDIKEMMASGSSIEEILSDDKQQQAYEIEELQERMAQIVKPQLRREFKYVDRKAVKTEIRYNHDLALGLNKLFRKVSEKWKDDIDYTGEEVNVETYIENLVEGKDRTKSMVSKKLDKGLSILLSIDASGSMDFLDKIDNVRALVKTLYKSIENIDNINLSAVVWSSDSNGIVGIQHIDSIKDIEKIATIGGSKLTPTHLALEYSSEKLMKMKGRKKLLIMITDGIPEYRSNQFLIPIGNMIKMCKKSYAYARRKTPNMVCLLISDRSSSRTRNTSPYTIMKQIFGKKVINCSNVNDASERVIKEFKFNVLRALQ